MTMVLPEQDVPPRIAENGMTVRFFVDDERRLEEEASRRGVSTATVIRERIRASYRGQ